MIKYCKMKRDSIRVEPWKKIEGSGGPLGKLAPSIFVQRMERQAVCRHLQTEWTRLYEKPTQNQTEQLFLMALSQALTFTHTKIIMWKMARLAMCFAFRMDTAR